MAVSNQHEAHRPLVKIGLQSINHAVDLGLTNTQIANATGASNLADVIEDLSVHETNTGLARQASKGFMRAVDAGAIINSEVTGAATAADVRAAFTDEDSTLASTEGRAFNF